MSALQVSGRLARDAEARFSTDGTAWLAVELQPDGGQGLALLAARRFDASAAAGIAARRTAYRLRAGARVRVHAAGAVFVHERGPCLRLLDVDLIETLALAGATHYTEEALAP